MEKPYPLSKKEETRDFEKVYGIINTTLNKLTVYSVSINNPFLEVPFLNVVLLLNKTISIGHIL